MNNFKKFKSHLKNAGLYYAFWRGVKYFIFLAKQQKDRHKQANNEIYFGKTKIICSDSGVNIFLDNKQITKNSGLNSGINTLGIWTDSSKALWQILEKGDRHLKIKVTFKELPLSQIWFLSLEDNLKLDWTIDLEIKECLCIDEFRAVCLVNPCYKNWVVDFKQNYFPRLDNTWHDLYRDEQKASLVGARFSLGHEKLPSLILEVNNNFYPLIQNPLLENGIHIVGFRHIFPFDKREHSQGSYRIFSGKILLFEDESLLDAKIENLRKDCKDYVDLGIKKTINVKGQNKRLKVLLTNLPWYRDKKWGVRAGSRWPHIKDESEGNYLPFPFFLAYATALLQKNNIDVSIIDAIAEQMPEDKFFEKTLNMNIDYLVAETSVPSFLDDLKVLERIKSQGISIILCGPNVEIYKPEFLLQHQFIDFVLFGEYEFSLRELVNALQENKDLSVIKGLIYRNGDKIIKNNPREPLDINLLSWPDRESLPMNKYWDLPGDIPSPSVQMLASRGCPFGCSFCLWPQVMYHGNNYRARDIEDVVNEMEYLVKDKRYKSVYFDDDTFNIGKERMIRFCQAIKEKNLEKTPWAIMARADLMDEEILKEMKSSGLSAVKYGVESSNQLFLESCDKKMDLQKTTKMIKLTKELGIKTHLTFTFGLPGENKDTIKKTVDYAISLDPDSIQFSILTPFPGTALFRELEESNRILTKDWSKYDGHYSCVFKPDNMMPQDLEIAKRKAYQLWSDYKRRKRGFCGDLSLFCDYLKKYGFLYAMMKTCSYFQFVWFKRKRYLSATDR